MRLCATSLLLLGFGCPVFVPQSEGPFELFHRGLSLLLGLQVKIMTAGGWGIRMPENDLRDLDIHARVEQIADEAASENWQTATGTGTDRRPADKLPMGFAFAREIHSVAARYSYRFSTLDPRPWPVQGNDSRKIRTGHLGASLPCIFVGNSRMEKAARGRGFGRSIEGVHGRNMD